MLPPYKCGVRDLLAAAKASPRLGLGTSLKIPRACSPLVLLIGSSLYSGYCLPYSLSYRPLLSTPCDSCSTCLLHTVYPGNTPYNWRLYFYLTKRFIIIKC